MIWGYPYFWKHPDGQTHCCIAHTLWHAAIGVDITGWSQVCQITFFPRRGGAFMKDRCLTLFNMQSGGRWHEPFVRKFEQYFRLNMHQKQCIWQHFCAFTRTTIVFAMFLRHRVRKLSNTPLFTQSQSCHKSCRAKAWGTQKGCKL